MPFLGAPRKSLELQLVSQPVEVDMVILSTDRQDKKRSSREKNDVLEYPGSRNMAKILTEFNQKVERKVDAGLRATEGMGGNCDQFRWQIKIEQADHKVERIWAQ